VKSAVHPAKKTRTRRLVFHRLDAFIHLLAALGISIGHVIQVSRL
jgi:hypothetical protein